MSGADTGVVRPGIRRFLPAIILPFLLLGCRTQAGYPDRPIRLICPWAVGGGTDRLSRQLALFLEVELGMPVNVVNITGGGGISGHRAGAEARPDGYTVTMMTVEINMLKWRGLTRLSWDDFVPVGLINRDPAALFVSSDPASGARWQSLDSLVEYVREHPGQLKASGTATGGIWHLALAGWLDSIGLSPGAMKWIPMNGAGPSLQELLSGGVDVVVCSPPEAKTFLESGQVRCLGVMSEDRVDEYPDFPTFREQGANWTTGGWRGLGLPRGGDPQVAGILSAALERVLLGETRIEGRSLPEIMSGQGFNVSWAAPNGFAELMHRTDDQLGKLLTSPEFEELRTIGKVNPMTFPLIVAGGLAVSLVVLIGRSLLAGRKASSQGSGRPLARWLNFAEAILVVALFVLVVERVGFVLSGGSALFYLQWRLGARPWQALVVTLVFIPLVYQLFANWLKVPLPQGWFGW